VDEIQIYSDPEIVGGEGETTLEQACLSLPNIEVPVKCSVIAEDIHCNVGDIVLKSQSILARRAN
jgi:hypothetical protein